MRSLMMKAPLVLFASLLAVAAVACSDPADDGGGANGGGSVDGSKKFSELSDGEVKSFCEDFRAWMTEQVSDAEFLKASCNARGVYHARSSEPSTDEELRAECKEGRDACLAAPPDVDIECEDIEKDERLKSCAGTVGEHRKCYADLFAHTKSSAKGDLCAETTLASLEDQVSTLNEMPESCKALEEKCPGLVDG